jgi:hypothetical protein
MSLKHSLASKARWANISVEDKKKKMSNVAQNRWNKMSKEERSEYARMMLRARYKV